MAYCEKICDGCKLAEIEDPAERMAAVGDVKTSFDALDRSLVRVLDHQGLLGDVIESVCQDTPESLEWKEREAYDPDKPIRRVNVPVVAAAVLRIAKNECPNNHVPSVLTS